MKCALVIFYLGFIVINAQKDMPNIFNYCQSSIYLSDHGQNSSISLALSPNPSKSLYTLNQPCRVHITAPSTHLLYIRIVENITEYSTIQNSENFDTKTQENIENNEELFREQLEDYVKGKPVAQKRSQPTEIEENCPVHVYQPELSNQPSYSINSCASTLGTEGGLVSHEADLTFTPGSKLTSRRVLITAVGAGEVCLNAGQHSCLQAGWTPLLCISKDLLCDGVVNCPTGGILGDENQQMCKDKKSMTATNWEKLANDFLKKFTGKSNGGRTLLPAIQKGHNRWMDSLQSTTSTSFVSDATPSPNTTNPNITNTLAQYGPWGYLMLGMLICGTVLTFCGLWECCCRRTKPSQVPQAGTATPSGISVSSGGVVSTAVLVPNSGPPKYEELDQPPSYSVLFPEKEDV